MGGKPVRQAETCGIARGVELALYRFDDHGYDSAEDHPARRAFESARSLPLATDMSEVRTLGFVEKQVMDVASGYMTARRIGSGSYVIEEGVTVKALDELPQICDKCPEKRTCYLAFDDKEIKVDLFNKRLMDTIQRYGLDKE